VSAIEEFSFNPTPINQLIEERFPFSEQMKKLAALLAPLQPPPPPPPPTRWDLFKAVLKGSL